MNLFRVYGFVDESVIFAEVRLNFLNYDSFGRVNYIVWT